MKKVRVHVSKGYLFSIFVFSLGLFLFIFGNVAYYREKNAVDLSELSVENCQKGTYVKGYINSYIVKATYNIYIGMILIATSVGCFMLAGGLREFFHEVKQEFKEAFHKR